MHRFKSVLLAPALLAVPLLSPAGESAGETVLEEIVVTGLLRGQALAQAPVSVAVLDAQTLRDAGQQHFQDVLALVPNLNWASGTSRPRYFQIRGIGEREQYEGAPNPSVGFLIDDMDFSGLGMPATLFDLQRIEVLRGPQGTRYGANALAGLIVVRSQDPGVEAGYSLEATGGDFGTRALGFTATAPVAALDSAWRVSVQKQRSDGFMRNAWLGRDDTNGRDELTARAKWRWQASEASTVDLAWLHADLDNGYDAWAIDNSRVSLSDEPGRDAQRANGASLRLTRLARGGNTLTAIGSYVDSRSVNSFDANWGNDQSWAPYTYRYFSRSDRRRETANVELRLASPAANPAGGTAWLVGAYALRLDEHGSDLLRGEYAEPGYASSGVDTLDNRYDATNLALFGQLDGHLSPRWRWSAGLRVEQRRARYRDAGTIDGEPRLTAQSARDRMVGGQVSLGTDLTANTAAYLSLARGYKAGGFNLGNVPEGARRFDPEYLWNLESGLRTATADGRGRAELAVFYQWRKDQQVRTGRQLDPTNPGTYLFLTANLPRGYSAGVEASGDYALTRTLGVGASLGLLRSRSGASVDAAGNPIASREQAHAPQYTAAVHATWRHPAGWMARVDVTSMDDFYFDVPTDHDMRSRAYTLAHLRLGYETGRWSAHAWLRNAFDKDHAVRGFFFSNEPPAWENKLYLQKGDPRQFGVTASLRF